MKNLKYYRYFLEYCLIISIYKGLALLSFKSMSTVAKILAPFFFMVPQVRRLIKANLKIAFPDLSDKDVLILARKNAENQLRMILDFFWCASFPEKVSEIVEIPEDTWTKIKRLQQSGGVKGGIFVTPHLGNWELAGYAIKNTNIGQIAVVVRKNQNPFLNDLVHSSRIMKGNRVIYEKGAVRGMIKAIKDDCFVATLIDQNTRVRDGGVFIDFFGLPVSSSRAPAMFARKLQVPILIGECVRVGDKYHLNAWELSKDISEYESDEELTRELMEQTQTLIRRNPDQYLWLYKRFQNIPIDASEELAKRYPYYAFRTTKRFYDHRAPKERKK